MTARLPGIAFVTPARTLAEALPRMDIACFVGFAGKGPLHTPIVVDSPEAYARHFGADLPLLHDHAGGETVFAHLGPAVRAFFANGGRRAWVIRVGEAARSNRLPLPGVCRPITGGRLLPTLLTAASPGSWSDHLKLASSLVTLPLALRGARLLDGRLQLDLAGGDTLLAGDLLQAEWDDGRIAFLPYAGAAPIAWNALRWFRAPQLPSRARRGYGRIYRAGFRHRFAVRCDADWDERQPVVVADLPGDRAPRPGETLKLHLGGAEYWLLVDSCALADDGGYRVAGRGLRRLSRTPTSWPADAARLVGLRLNLHVAEAGDTGERTYAEIRDLGFGAGHPRALADLADETLVWRGAAGGALPFLPLGLAATPTPALPAIPLAESRLTRDGLRHFGARLFLDPALADARTAEIGERADRVRFTGARPRPLRGLHAAWGLDEVTLLCVPDAAHRPWQRVPPREPVAPAASPPRPAPANACPAGSFAPCRPQQLPAPTVAADPADQLGALRLHWTEIPGSPTYRLEEARDPQWRDAFEIYRGGGTEFILRDRPSGDWYYRVCFESPAVWSDWSAGLHLRIDPAAGWKLDEAADYRDDDLVAVQRALVRLAAARGDTLAVLALPRHYRAAQALAHVDRLRGDAPARVGDDAASFEVPALAPVEAGSWSYAALYHPWLRRLDAAGLPAVPADGALTGLMARRALERGAWVAPANLFLTGFAGLDSAFAADQRSLAAGVNPIGRDGLRLPVLDALTLSVDADTRPINVRRLLCLLRRLLLRQGAQFVFEPHGEALRRAVDSRLRHWLDTLLARGALAGSRPDEAYRLRVDAGVNPPASVDAGRLVIEIAIAPAQALRFLTVRLVAVGGNVQLEEF